MWASFETGQDCFLKLLRFSIFSRTNHIKCVLINYWMCQVTNVTFSPGNNLLCNTQHYKPLIILNNNLYFTIRDIDEPSVWDRQVPKGKCYCGAKSYASHVEMLLLSSWSIAQSTATLHSCLRGVTVTLTRFELSHRRNGYPKPSELSEGRNSYPDLSELSHRSDSYSDCPLLRLGEGHRAAC